jgi:hypothetical protein
MFSGEPAFVILALNSIGLGPSECTCLGYQISPFRSEQLLGSHSIARSSQQNGKLCLQCFAVFQFALSSPNSLKSVIGNISPSIDTQRRI